MAKQRSGGSPKIHKLFEYSYRPVLVCSVSVFCLSNISTNVVYLYNDNRIVYKYISGNNIQILDGGILQANLVW